MIGVKIKMNKDKAEQIKKYAEVISDYLKEESPHISVVITDSEVKIIEDLYEFNTDNTEQQQIKEKQELMYALKILNNTCINNSNCETCPLCNNNSEIFNCNLLSYHPSSFDKVINKVKDK